MHVPEEVRRPRNGLAAFRPFWESALLQESNKSTEYLVYGIDVFPVFQERQQDTLPFRRYQGVNFLPSMTLSESWSYSCDMAEANL